jgi:DNA polymerase IIIc chi subunit
MTAWKFEIFDVNGAGEVLDHKWINCATKAEAETKWRHYRDQGWLVNHPHPVQYANYREYRDVCVEECINDN